MGGAQGMRSGECGAGQEAGVGVIGVPFLLRMGGVQPCKRACLCSSPPPSSLCVHACVRAVHLLKEAEVERGAAARPKRPRALVLGPTRELTDQILR